MVRDNGIKTYFASDIAFMFNKRERGFEHLLYVWGADHHGYIARLRAGLIALGGPPECFEVRLVQFVTLFRGGEKAQMSTRSGEFVTLRALRAEVGNDAARLFYVMRSNDQHLDFDLELAKARSNDNPVYYIQYAHARVASVKRQLQRAGLRARCLAGRGLAHEAHRAAGNQAHQAPRSYPGDRGATALCSARRTRWCITCGISRTISTPITAPTNSRRGRGAARCAIEPRARHAGGDSQRPASGGRIGARDDVAPASMARDYKPKRKRPGGGFSGWLRRRLRLGRRDSPSQRRFTSRTIGPTPSGVKLVAKPDKKRSRGGDAGEADSSDRAHPTIPRNPMTFYDMLPKFEVVVPEKEKDVRPDTRAVPETRRGTYVLQAGSYKNFADADRVRAQIGAAGRRVQGPESLGRQRYLAPHPHRSRSRIWTNSTTCVPSCAKPTWTSLVIRVGD